MAQKNSDDKKSTGQKKFRPKLAEIIPPLDFSFMNLRSVEGVFICLILQLN